MVDVYRRSILDQGVWEQIRGNTGSGGPIDRSTLVAGTYNPVYYSGNPSQGGDYNTNRVGYYGPASIASETEGTNLTYSTNGQVVNSTVFYRRVTNAAQNTVFNNCLFLGTPTDAAAPLTCSTASVNPTFNDCTFAPMAPQYSTACVRIGLGGGTFNRCDFYGGIDGISNNSTVGWPQQWNVNQCAFHDMLYLSPDPDAAGGLPDNASHTDMIQWGGGKLKLVGSGLWAFYDMFPHRWQANMANVAFGTGVTSDASDPFDYHFAGNRFTDTASVPGDGRIPTASVGAPSIYATSCIMFSPMYLGVQYFEADKCYFNGTTFALNIGDATLNNGSATTFTDFRFTNNKIGTNHRWPVNGTTRAFTWAGSNEANMLAVSTISGNTNLATGAALVYADMD